MEVNGTLRLTMETAGLPQTNSVECLNLPELRKKKLFKEAYGSFLYLLTFLGKHENVTRFF